MKQISWLHLSDLHVGMNDQHWMWPSLKRAFYEDLKRIYELAGPWDLVIFSGDLVQSGKSGEFDKLTLVLKELWGFFSSLGFSPKLFCIPGNHDIERPGDMDSHKINFENWWSTPELHRGIWSPEGVAFIRAQRKYHQNYIKWIQKTIDEGEIPLLSGTSGVMPGDSFVRYDNGQISIGLVGLNSTWLQISKKAQEGMLHVDPVQLLSVLDQKPDEKLAEQDFNILVTHHPTSWLYQKSSAAFNEHINLPGRFIAHLFGHMHVSGHVTTALGGSKAKTSIQAPSLFGLESGKNGLPERIHGYSLHKLVQEDDGRSLLYVYPRKDNLNLSGARQLADDTQYELGMDHRYSIPVEMNGKKKILDNPGVQDYHPVMLGVLGSEKPDELEMLRYHLQPAPENRDVRMIEINRCIKALNEKRCVWVAAEWGMGYDGFLWFLQCTRGDQFAVTYRLDFSKFTSLAGLLDSVKSTTGLTLERIVVGLQSAERTYLILDDVPNASTSNHLLLTKLESMVETILQHCQGLVVVVRSRVEPARANIVSVALQSLDLADTRSYLLNHRSGGTKYSSSESVMLIHRHTDGVPLAIDSALKNLEVVSLSELPALMPDIAGEINDGGVEDLAVKRALEELAGSEDPVLAKSYKLLKALVMFPKGEPISRIKGFYPRDVFHPTHGATLIARGLARSEDEEVQFGNDRGVQRYIQVPRLVRECFIGSINPAQFQDLNNKAAAIYFGPEWESGKFKPPGSLRFHQKGRSVSELNNAHAIIQRLINQCEGFAQHKLDNLLAMIGFHVYSLLQGDYYRAAADLLQDVMPLLDVQFEEAKLVPMKLHYATALRMTNGDDTVQRAKEILDSINEEHLTNSQKQDRLQMLALGYRSIDDNVNALRAADEMLKISKTSVLAMSAMWLKLELGDEDNKLTKLARLEQRATARKSPITAQNIALTRAALQTSSLERKKTLLATIESAEKTNNTYNAIRGIVLLGEEVGLNATRTEKINLHKAYFYLYNEGMLNLFNRCHDLLWNIFESEKDSENLFQLFRYSSLVWRLRGEDEREKDAVLKLGRYMQDTYQSHIGVDPARVSYYLSRKSSATNLISSDDT